MSPKRKILRNSTSFFLRFPPFYLLTSTKSKNDFAHLTSLNLLQNPPRKHFFPFSSFFSPTTSRRTVSNIFSHTTIQVLSGKKNLSPPQKRAQAPHFKNRDCTFRCFMMSSSRNRFSCTISLQQTPNLQGRGRGRMQRKVFEIHLDGVKPSFVCCAKEQARCSLSSALNLKKLVSQWETHLKKAAQKRVGGSREFFSHLHKRINALVHAQMSHYG
ncbi:hypothetical protein CDAR_253071 [Caerostris darwini]|uniref:Uncharacterized protein n=1 Tax=Caerostris darwini TaxID=1538125 RepID=A0AAV4R981_9ARAC|nr:hypothetical protein CDAR_253071 [Caerostris darwini]